MTWICVGCEQYYIGDRPESSKDGIAAIAARQGRGGESEANDSRSAGANEEPTDDNPDDGDETDDNENGAGGAGGAGGKNGGKAGGKGGSGATDAGLPKDPLEGIDAAAELVGDCKGFCEHESAVECQYTIPKDVCLKLCVAPDSMPVPGAGGDGLRKFFDCAKDKVLMCNEDTGRPEATNCMKEQFEFNSWILGNQWMGDAGYY